MKASTFIYIVALTSLLTGCQVFQIFDSPIPVISDRAVVSNIVSNKVANNPTVTDNDSTDKK